MPGSIELLVTEGPDKGKTTSIKNGTCRVVGRLLIMENFEADQTMLQSDRILDVQFKKEEIERYVSRHNLGDCVELSPATFDVASVFVRNHVVVVPSLWEGFGLVAREALASGRILLTSDVGGLTEGIERDVDALFASGNDTEEFAQKIRWIYEHRAEAEKIAVHGRQTALNNFGFEKTAEKYLELYKQVASQGI